MTSQQKPQISTLSIILAVGICLLILVVFWLLIWITALNNQVQDLKKEVSNAPTSSDILELEQQDGAIHDRIDNTNDRIDLLEKY